MKKILNLLTDYANIDKNKEPEVLLPKDVNLMDKIGNGTVEHFVAAVPYYIRKIYYAGNNLLILSELNKQFKKDGIVLVRPSIEVAIIITSFCNLACNNCNMLSNYKHRNSTMTLDTLTKFIANFNLDKNDTMIRLTGGEPTILGNDLLKAIELLHTNGFKYITVLTNGINDFDFPSYVSIENSSKEVGLPQEFNTQYEAPIDMEEFKDMPNEIYAGGCLQADVCGIAYDQKGRYFPCPTGASIYDSLVNAKLIKPYKASSVEETLATRHTFFNDICRYCGMFKKGGYHNIPTDLFSRTTEEPKTKTWKEVKII